MLYPYILPQVWLFVKCIGEIIFGDLLSYRKKLFSGIARVRILTKFDNYATIILVQRRKCEGGFSMIKRITAAFLCLIICLLSISLFPACSSSSNEIVFRASDGYVQWKYLDSREWNNLLSIADLNEDGALNGKSAYDIAVSQGFSGTQEEWISSLKGDRGDSVYIGKNGNWWVGDCDTGVSAISLEDQNLYVVPDFTGMTVPEIKVMPGYTNFILSFYGILDNNTASSQSIAAGTVVAKNTKIKVYMNGYTPPDAPKEDKITLKHLTTPVSPGDMATVQILGSPFKQYTIQVLYSSGESEAFGLEEKMSDQLGNVIWTWKVGSSTREGMATIIISDGSTSLTAYMNIEYTMSK